MNSERDVVYVGYRRRPGGSFIAVVGYDGEHIGVVAHLPRHSPTGLGWGYYGSGAADCARSLLIAALGQDAICSVCNGTAKVVFDGGGKQVPYVEQQAATYEPELIGRCPCEDGYCVPPAIYQAFKEEFVARWDDRWQMSRRQIVTWFEQHAVGG